MSDHLSDDILENTQPPLNNEGDAAGPVAKTFLRIASLGMRSVATSYRLKPGDVIVCLEGEFFFGSAEDFETALDKEDNQYSLLTVFREGFFFEVLVEGALRCSLEFMEVEKFQEIRSAFDGHTIHKKSDYRNFEVLRDIRRNCTIYDTTPSPLAGTFPPLWLIQNRLWEPLMAISLAYFISYGVSLAMFALTYLLSAFYFNRGQIHVMRSYAQFQEKQMWIVVAARTIQEAQMLCRKLDPYCKFAFSHVPPPEPMPDPEDMLTSENT